MVQTMSAPRRRKGATTVEMAVALPLLLGLTFGLIEYGWMFLKVQQITGAARVGARVAILPDATDAHVRDVIAQEMTDAGMPDYTLTFTPADITAPGPGEPVKVYISVQYEERYGLGMPLVPVPQDLHAFVTMSKEGP